MTRQKMEINKGFMIFTLITLFLSLSSYKINEKEYNKLGEFFNGLKKENKFRAFAAIMMARRFIFVVLIITSVSISSKILIGVLAGIQVFYFITIAIVRPYDETQANMIDIINEFVFLILLTSLIFYNTVDDWTITVAYIYMQILVMNSVIDFLIVQAFQIKLVCLWLKNKISKPKIIPSTPNVGDPIQSMEIMVQNKKLKRDGNSMNIDNIGIYEENKEEEKFDFYRNKE